MIETGAIRGLPRAIDFSQGSPIRVHPFRGPVDEEYRQRWRARIVPELLWLAVMLRRFGVGYGLQIADAFTRAVRTHANSHELALYATAGSYGALDRDTVERIRASMAESDLLRLVEPALSSLTELLPDWPLAPFAPAGQARAEDRGILAESLLDLLADCDEPTTRSGLLLQAGFLWLCSRSGVLRVGAGSQLDRLRQVTDFPATPESLLAARRTLDLAALLTGRPELFPQSDWPEHFRQRLRELAVASRK